MKKRLVANSFARTSCETTDAEACTNCAPPDDKDYAGATTGPCSPYCCDIGGFHNIGTKFVPRATVFRRSARCEACSISATLPHHGRDHLTLGRALVSKRGILGQQETFAFKKILDRYRFESRSRNLRVMTPTHTIHVASDSADRVRCFKGKQMHLYVCISHQRLTLPVLSLGTVHKVVHQRHNDHQELQKLLSKHRIPPYELRTNTGVIISPHLGRQIYSRTSSCVLQHGSPHANGREGHVHRETGWAIYHSG